MVELTSDIMYLLSLNAYSFHSWPNRSIAGAMRVWFNEKYPSKKRWIDPAKQLVSRHIGKRVRAYALKINHNITVLSSTFSCGTSFDIKNHVTPKMQAHPPRNMERRVIAFLSFGVWLKSSR